MTEYYLGIDPGATTGLALVGVAEDRTLVSVTGCVVRQPSRGTRTRAETDHRWRQRLRWEVWKMVPVWYGLYHVVLEEPADVSDGRGWGKKRRGAPVARRGTAFRIGVAYGVAIGAIPEEQVLSLTSYPVVGTVAEPGWMGPRVAAQAAYARVRLVLQSVAQQHLVTPAPVDWTDDMVAACGVVLHHLTRRGTR